MCRWQLDAGRWRSWQQHVCAQGSQTSLDGCTWVCHQPLSCMHATAAAQTASGPPGDQPIPPSSPHPCHCAGLGCGLGLLALLLLSCCQLTAAQNYTALRQGVWLPPLCKIDNITEAKEYDGLLEKLPQIKNRPAEQQLQLLSANSRSKLNNLTGNAAEVRRLFTAAGLRRLCLVTQWWCDQRQAAVMCPLGWQAWPPLFLPHHSLKAPCRLCCHCCCRLQWLKNRTDSELEELFENVRAENFRRVMAMAAIGTQLRKAFTSVNVLGCVVMPLAACRENRALGAGLGCVSSS